MMDRELECDGSSRAALAETALLVAVSMELIGTWSMMQSCICEKPLSCQKRSLSSATELSKCNAMLLNASLEICNNFEITMTRMSSEERG